MKRKNLLIILALWLFTNSAIGQKRPPVNIWNPPVQKNLRSLVIGDTVPDFKIAKIFNDNRKTARMSDFKDQLVIFDFGNLYCKGCVEALPHMDSLQKRFGNRIRIFWVTPEYEEDVARFWNRKNNELTRNNNLAVIVEDSTVRAYFKHKSWPHEAWVYKGKLVALTSAQYVDSNNISKVLGGEKISWPVKNDFETYDKQRLLFELNRTVAQGSKGTSVRYTAISGFKEGIAGTETLSGGSGIIRDAENKTVRVFFLNQPVYNSYLLNLIKLMKPGMYVKPSSYGIAPNEVHWEMTDQSRYLYGKHDGYQADWLRKHGICYESLNPDTGQTDQDIAKSVIADLNRLLNLNVRWERRKEHVLVVVNIPDNEKEPTKEVNRSGNEMALSTLLYQLNQQPANPYVFNGTGYADKDLKLQLNIQSWTDILSIRKAIRSFGLDLKEEERMVDKVVFSETNHISIKNNQ